MAKRATLLLVLSTLAMLVGTASSLTLISSKSSKLVKNIIKLNTKRKARHDQAKVVVEGPKMIFDLLKTHKKGFVNILVDETKLDDFRPTIDNDIPLFAATPQVLKLCSGTETNQGIVALCDMPQTPWPVTIPNFTLVLDGIQDPGNVGTLLRSSVATGVDAVICQACCDVWNPKAVRSAMGATFHMPIATTETWAETKALLGDTNIWASTMQEGGSSPSLPHYQVDWVDDAPIALVIGSEGRGLHADVRDDTTIRTAHVPMNPGVESLNAAVCGSVILFEYLRQRQK